MNPQELLTTKKAQAIGVDDDMIVVTIPPGYKLYARVEDENTRLDVYPMGPTPGKTHVGALQVVPASRTEPSGERAVVLEKYVPAPPLTKKQILLRNAGVLLASLAGVGSMFAAVAPVSHELRIALVGLGLVFVALLFPTKLGAR